MRAKFNTHCTAVTFFREEGDPKFHGTGGAKGEHALFHHIKTWLNARGFELIKKRAQSDGHMIGDEYQPYLRCRKPAAGIPHIYIWSGFYQIRGANEDWNSGEVTLIVTPDCYERGQDTVEMVGRICELHSGEISMEVPRKATG